MLKLIGKLFVVYIKSDSLPGVQYRLVPFQYRLCYDLPNRIIWQFGKSNLLKLQHLLRQPHHQYASQHNFKWHESDDYRNDFQPVDGFHFFSDANFPDDIIYRCFVVSKRF